MEKEQSLALQAQESHCFERMIIALGASAGSWVYSVVFFWIGILAARLKDGEFFKGGDKGGSAGNFSGVGMFLIGGLVGIIILVFWIYRLVQWLKVRRKCQQIERERERERERAKWITDNCGKTNYYPY